MTTDPLDDSHGLPVGRSGVVRDQQGNAMLRPEGSSFTVPYTPASGLADYLKDSVHLARHDERSVARGLGIREDLAARAGSIPWSPGFVDDVKLNSQHGRELDAVVLRAKDAAGALVKADYGTTFHQVTEPGVVEAGGYVPARMESDVASFWHAMRGFEIVATELFVVCDELGTAGTLDHLVRMPNHPRLLIVDKKTGKLDPKDNGVQLTTYARGEVYDRETHERTPFLDLYGVEVDTNLALIAHTPAGGGVTHLVEVDLERGHASATLAAKVRDYHKDSTTPRRTVDTDRLASERVRELLLEAKTPAEMSVVYERFSDVWTAELTKLGREVLNAR